jgi:integrase
MSGLDTWTPGELAAFIAAARGTRLEAAWHLAVFGGLRIGELLALRWTDVDLGHGRIEVRDAVVGVPYATIRPAPISRRARAINVGLDLAALLHEHRARQCAERTEWGPHYSDHDLVVCRENGKPLHPRRLSRAFERVAEQAGLRPTGLPTLRRTRALAAQARRP